MDSPRCFHVPVILEVRSALNYEEVTFEAREKDGVKMPAVTIQRQFIQCELVDDTDFPQCKVVPDRRVDLSKMPVVSRGVVIRAWVVGFAVEKDVPTLKVLGWTLQKKS